MYKHCLGVFFLLFYTNTSSGDFSSFSTPSALLLALSLSVTRALASRRFFFSTYWRRRIQPVGVIWIFIRWG